MLIKMIFSQVEEMLEENGVVEAVIGRKTAAVQLTNGGIGTAFVLNEEITEDDVASSFADMAKGERAVDVAKWALEPEEHILRRTLALAVINACAFSQELVGEELEAAFSVDVGEDDVVGCVGLVRPLIAEMKKKAKRVIAYDKGREGEKQPLETQDELLPSCDVVFITGSTFINNTIDHLLSLCDNAREIVIVGPTTPMFPKAYEGTNVTMLSGGVWKQEMGADIFETIAFGEGVPKLTPYLNKKSIRVKAPSV